MTANTVQNRNRPARVLLIEDNQGDVILTRRAFQESQIANQLYVATTGEEAIAVLGREGKWAEIEAPDLILLDLNLPMMSGQDVLKFIKGSDNLRHVPVIILSSSSAEEDIVKSYNLHANGYIVKPANFDTFNEVVQKLEQFWFTLVMLPDGSSMRTN